MAYSAVDLAILKAADRFAKIKDIAISGIGASSNSFWKLKDATAAVAYENRIDGTNVSRADTSISEMKLGKMLGVSTWFGNHNTYLTTDAGFTGGWTGYLDTIHARVPEYFGDVYNEVYSRKMAAKYIAAQHEDATNILGTFDHAQTAAASTDVAALSTDFGPTRLGVVVTETINDGGSDPLHFNISVTDGTNDYTYTDVSIADTTAAGATVVAVIGYTGSDGADNIPTALVHGASTTVITFTATPPGIAVDGWVLISGASFATETQTTIKEYVKVTAKTATTITVTRLYNRGAGEFVTSNVANIRVYPCWSEVTAITPTNATQPDTAGTVKIVPVNDRPPTL